MKEQLMKNNKGIANLAVIGIVLGCCIIGAIISEKYLGPNNAIEKELEVIAEHEIEDSL